MKNGSMGSTTLVEKTRLRRTRHLAVFCLTNTLKISKVIKYFCLFIVSVMKPAHLDRLLRLIRTTGERVVITDPETSDLLVLMHLDEYEQLTGTSTDTEDELDDEEFPNLDFECTEPQEVFNALPAKIRPPQPTSFQSMPLQSRVKTSVSPAKVMPTSSAGNDFPPPSPQLEFDEPNWHADSEDVFLNEEMIAADELIDVPEEEEEEKFYLEPVE